MEYKLQGRKFTKNFEKKVVAYSQNVTVNFTKLFLQMLQCLLVSCPVLLGTSEVDCCYSCLYYQIGNKGSAMLQFHWTITMAINIDNNELHPSELWNISSTHYCDCPLQYFILSSAIFED